MGHWVPSFLSSISSELDSEHPFIHFSFATVDSHGSPHVRTVVFRSFLFDNSKTNVLTFCTDKRMKKYKELYENCKFEACFYFSKSKKQFRFSGIAKIIDEENQPIIDFPQGLAMKENISSETIISSFEKNENDDDVVNLEGEYYNNNNNNKIRQVQADTLVYPLLSPSIVAKYNSREKFESAVPAADLVPPTQEEWIAEWHRQWSSLSRSMKSTFRKPTPGSKITPEKKKLLDALGRRVDGGNDDAGLKNFALIALFADTVDYVDLETSNNRRIIDVRVDGDQWKEIEVCP
ncbi:hypothetical protein PACTADRAFT_51521 [Pachysolen tannophilus NRRL Y-2460]|uniref:Pyridoxamine 5'-phosphate oxidase Alr4036 family FMN-binding domain-containing protein n=1 Tax=Pachysolen tannophilus NRRL Y-2460 TaxID=669874 RepID=A0A1E4TPS4_PACTA|nr:hypothetical protein PACTADRAFT_51521 [Pachysolen tannophilus NRRL Y-2460]